MGATFFSTGAFGEPFATGGSIPKGLNSGIGTPDASNFVPDGEVWEIHVASVGQTSAGSFTGLTCSLHIERDLGAQGIHMFAVTEQRDASKGTPFLALPRRILLLPKMRLGVRFNSPPQGLTVSLMAYGFSYPLADLDRLLLSGAIPALNFSAVTTAAQDAATALTTLAASVP